MLKYDQNFNKRNLNKLSQIQSLNTAWTWQLTLYTFYYFHRVFTSNRYLTSPIPHANYSKNFPLKVLRQIYNRIINSTLEGWVARNQRRPSLKTWHLEKKKNEYIDRNLPNSPYSGHSRGPACNPNIRSRSWWWCRLVPGRWSRIRNPRLRRVLRGRPPPPPQRCPGTTDTFFTTTPNNSRLIACKTLSSRPDIFAWHRRIVPRRHGSFLRHCERSVALPVPVFYL